MRGFDALLMPTTPDTAPTIAEVTASDESYFRFNGRMLRNPALVNLFDGCALSIPCHRAGEAPVGLMLAGMQDQDGHVLSLGLAIEKLMRELTLVLALLLRFEFAVSPLRAFQHFRRSHGVPTAAEQADEPAHQQRGNQDHRDDEFGHQLAKVIFTDSADFFAGP